ncbi:hypothetical protein HYU45_00845 [Candidatus Daviesbacteria bacterium]|nr:hypothetical protein [Candidatus Daviesbacteria bacterium]
MSKIFSYKLIVAIFFLFFAFSLLPESTMATLNDCSFTFDPPQPNTYMKDLTITVSSAGLPSSGGNYLMVVQDPRDHCAYTWSRGSLPSYIFGGMDGNCFGSYRGWQNRDYQVYLFNGDVDYKSGAFGFIGRTDLKQAICVGSFQVALKSIQDSCKAIITTKPIDPNTTVQLEVENILPDKYKIIVEPRTAAATPKKEFEEKIDTSTAPARFNLDTFIPGTYSVSIYKDSKLQCAQESFQVGPMGSGEGGRIVAYAGIDQCKQKDVACSLAGGQPVTGCNDAEVPDPNDPNKTIPNPNPGIATAIGCIHTNPVEFTKDIMKFVLGISGGLAFLMMLLGAFQILSSADNPDTLHAGRERLTSAVIGLLIVIFAILLLQIIGVGILDIPGFK